MKRWNIGAADVPLGSEIRFRDSRVWQQYPWETATAAGALLLQAALIFVLSTNIAAGVRQSLRCGNGLMSWHTSVAKRPQASCLLQSHMN